ncbi:MAG: bifunctional metallophosphatase/5'-nucleotidase, partial [Cutibacterium acnes]
MNHRRRARIIGLSVLCMAAGSFVAKPAFAAPSTSGTSSAPVASCNGD